MPSSTFIVCGFFDDGSSDWCQVITHCSFDLHFSNNQQCRTYFHVPSGHLYVLLWLLRRRMAERYSQGVWNGYAHTALFKMKNQQGPTVQHKELCSVLYGSLDGKPGKPKLVHVTSDFIAGSGFVSLCSFKFCCGLIQLEFTIPGT